MGVDRSEWSGLVWMVRIRMVASRWLVDAPGVFEKLYLDEAVLDGMYGMLGMLGMYAKG